MTWLLQVLETHTFSRYKRCVEGECQDALVRGAVGIDQLLQCVYSAIEEAMQIQSWQAAFHDSGFGGHQDALCKSVSRRLKLDGLFFGFIQPPERRGGTALLKAQCSRSRRGVLANGLARSALPPAPAADVHAAPLPPPGRMVARSMAASSAAASPSAGEARHAWRQLLWHTACYVPASYQSDRCLYSGGFESWRSFICSLVAMSVTVPPSVF